MFGFFRKKKKNILEELNCATVKMYRPLLVSNKKVSDEKILEIVQTTMRAFTQAAESKGEKISGDVLMNISAKFIRVYDMSGQDFFLEHLKYEINKYLSEGLRSEYQQK
ncbi:MULTISPECIES: hypothetical protein [Vibrio]|uniref:hypothetical protein n=1 Tax=Vibrio TaxID=662 RepID=UPI001156D09F|nr:MULTISPECIES: hypothetical protein [Vibrio]MCX9575699.1 hypothetical protein [Vibrio cholerae]TQQ04037.1 hypothetical protein FLL71_17275 [Vibrio cholerae]WKY95380.1 hypothetical protein QYQ96_16015 [Vibrio metoecus]